MDEREKRTWAEIDLSNLEHNYRALRALLPQGCRFLGVVKAGAYGHGAVAVARRLEQLGCDYLAVACLDEAIELREGGIAAPILILGYTAPEYSGALLQYHLTQTVLDLESARSFSEAAARAGQRLTVHIKIDTGMSRLGLLCDEAHLDRAAEQVCGIHSLEGLYCEGIFTHFSDADGSEEYTMLQFTRFLMLLDKLGQGGVTFPIRHCAASAAVLNYPCTHLDMVRPGIALYGHYPAPGMEGLVVPALRSVMALKTRISAVRALPKGTCVSYGRTHTLARESRLAVLPIGYADGLPRRCSDGLQVLACGRKTRVVGRICMDMCMIDVTDSPQAKVGDVVTIYGEAVPIERAADLAGTVQYELLCAVSRRIPRVYLEGHQA